MEGILEGLLYVQGDNGLTLKEVMSILNLSEEEAKDVVYKLKIAYENDNRGLRLSYLGNTFKLTTKQEHKDYYERLLESPRTHTLSQAALEVLAIIVYNEPITRGQVDEMRGVDSTFMMRKLLAKGLIKESGRSDMPGHPTLYKTTDDFLDYFGLSTKDDLPDISKLEIELGEQGEKDLFQSNYKENIDEQKGFVYMNIIEIINKKRLGKILKDDELEFVINGYLDGSIYDYQMSSLLMAIVLKGMTDKEIISLTRIMLKSGERLDLSSLGNVVDKHSTGGVGDKTTMIIAPIVASCGVNVAKMSG